ncbi:MAG: flagellar brake protein [Desulfovibrionaceae bacterium]|nr:flagellar brake protein [Desulfovibrionaceae bacterium]MBF0514141.1 flagellar brake protein [Desulfovibrionaceae bacterium]
MEDQNGSLAIDLGAKLLLEIQGVNAKLNSSFVGLVKNKFLITQMPVLVDFEKEQLLQHLYPENKTTVRYLNMGTVLGFQSQIIKYIMVPFPMLFLTYPRKVESLNLRKHRRIRCVFPAVANFDSKQLEVIIVDLSDGGCGLFLRSDQKDTLKVDYDDIVKVQCPALGHGPDNPMDCVVKRFIGSGKGMELGLKFSDKESETLKQVRNFIGQVSNYV